MKLTINKLIANDIINYGMDQASEFNIAVGLDEYLEQYDEETQKYILDNLDQICDDISNNERVADFIFDKKEKYFDMVFYWVYILDDLERTIFENSKSLNIDLEYEDIVEIAEDFKNKQYDDLINKIKSYSLDREVDL